MWRMILFFRNPTSFPRELFLQSNSLQSLLLLLQSNSIKRLLLQSKSLQSLLLLLFLQNSLSITLLLQSIKSLVSSLKKLAPNKSIHRLSIISLSTKIPLLSHLLLLHPTQSLQGPTRTSFSALPGFWRD